MCCAHNQKTFFCSRGGESDFLFFPPFIFLQTTFSDEPPPLPHETRECRFVERKREKPQKKRVRQIIWTKMYAIKSIKIQSNIRVGRVVIRIREGIVHRRLIETATEHFFFFRFGFARLKQKYILYIGGESVCVLELQAYTHINNRLARCRLWFGIAGNSGCYYQAHDTT